jgi:hypothetical protein
VKLTARNSSIGGFSKKKEGSERRQEKAQSPVMSQPQLSQDRINNMELFKTVLQAENYTIMTTGVVLTHQ